MTTLTALEKCHRKVQYPTKHDAKLGRRRFRYARKQDIYKCHLCRFWHLATPRKFSMIRNSELTALQLGSKDPRVAQTTEGMVNSYKESTNED